MLRWLHRQRAAGLILVVAGVSLIVGVALSAAAVRVAPEPRGAETVVRTLSRTVTIRLPGRVIRRVDHVLVVETPRYVFVYHGRVHILQPRRVRIRFRFPDSSAPPVVAAILGAATSASTVTVPVTVPIPGPTTTVEAAPTTVTTTVLDPTTITSVTTVTVPLENSSARRSR